MQTSLILGSVTATTQDTGIRCIIYNGWCCTKYYRKRKGLKLTISAGMKVSEESEQCRIAASK